MRLHVACPANYLTASLREFVERRVHFALGKFDGRIKAVSVRLASEQDPVEGEATSCVIQMDTGGRPMIIRERQKQIHEAVTRAVERAERAFERRLFLERAVGIGRADSTRHPR
jgi:ribosome-associated translation inhibitor RaiA